MKVAVWAAMSQMKSDDKQERFDVLLRVERRQHGVLVWQSLHVAGQSLEQTVEEVEMHNGQATPRN